MVRIDKEEIVPICPFCEAPLDRLIEVNRGWFAINRVLCCPQCHKVLGLTAGQG